ncbi:MAG: undecaprenyl/decaprenyl-phosphate alpha-N-acetylglucosaminyl 1-phosphate transferase, partial [Chitinophagaceae bacterium]|nr:undecaprenyl/decaprenyl-phosphate alpha-N-acetylglucosaminyl 1-phosphate transferase [Chitinophagaceae bacterium]
MINTFVSLYPLIVSLLCLVITFFISYFTIPEIIIISRRKRLVDKPDHRKIHTYVTPNLGGVALFSTTLIVTMLLDTEKYFPEYSLLFASMLLIFTMGLKDDLVEISPQKRIIFEFLSVMLIVLVADIRVKSMHGLFGIYELPYFVSVIFSIIGITFVTNAYNLIDGVDGLCGGLGLIGMLFLGTYFLSTNNIGVAMFAFCMAGALLGFLRYNFSRARIFMGDNGSLVLGLSITALCILFSERPTPVNAGGFLANLDPNGKLPIVIAIISI